MYHKEIYQCEVCATKIVKRVKDSQKRPIGSYIYSHCSNNCVYPDNVECIRKGYTKMKRIA